MKERVGRWRHVAFTIEGGGRLPRHDLNVAIRAAAKGAGATRAGDWQVTVLERERALVKVPLVDAAAARAALPMVRDVRGRNVQLTPVGTSGTIRAAKRKWLGSE